MACCTPAFLLSVTTHAQNGLQKLRFEAENGDPQAQTALADCYRTGNGTVQDLSAAFYWYQAAAERGYVPAQIDLGTMYHLGLRLSY